MNYPAYRPERALQPDPFRDFYAPARPNTDEPEETSWRLNVFGVIRRNLFLILACVVAVIAAAVFVVRRLPPVYEGTASLRIDPQKASLPTLDFVTPSSDISTEIEVLRSHALAQEVVDSLSLHFFPETPARMTRADLFSEWHVSPRVQGGAYRLERNSDGAFRLIDRYTKAQLATVTPGKQVEVKGATFVLRPEAAHLDRIDFSVYSTIDAAYVLQGNLVVDRPVKEANVVYVRYRSSDPELARDVPNTIVERFISQRQSSRQRAATSTARFLREQIDHIGAQLTSSEEQFRRFRESRGVVDLREEGRSEIGRVAQIQAQRNELETEQSALTKLLREVNARAAMPDSLAGSPFRNLVAFPSLLRNQAASQLLGSLATVEDRRAELLTRRSPEDPDVQLLTGRIREIGEQLRSMTTTYLKALNDQASSLDAELARSTGSLQQIPAKEAQFARLERQTKLYGDIYTLLQTRLKEAEIGAAAEDGTVRLLDAMQLPREPISPKPALTASLACIAGLLLGLSLAFARELLDKSVHSRRDVRLATGAPVLAMIPNVNEHRGISDTIRRALKRGEPAEAAEPPSNGAAPAVDGSNAVGALRRNAALASFSRLDANLMFLQPGRAMRAVVVTSPLPGDGKSTVALNLAMVAARQGRRVLLIDADLRRGSLGALFRTPSTPGLADVLTGASTFAQSVRTVSVSEIDELYFLPTGTVPPNPVPLFESPRMRELLAFASGEYDLILLDTPPLNPVPDAAALGRLSNGVLLVARAGVTPSHALTLAREHLEQAGAAAVGVVLNDIDFRRDATYDVAFTQFKDYAAYYHEVGRPSDD